MKDLLKRIKLDAIVSAAACITFGIVLILWPVQVTTIACQSIAVIIAILGAVRVISYIMESEAKHRLNLPLGLVLFVIGIWIFLKPASIQNMLLIGIGVVLFVHGLQAMRYAFYAKSNGYLQWWQLLMMALLGMGLGIACIVDCFGIISMTLTLVGVALVYDGVTLLWVISRVQKAARRVKREVQEWDAVESDITAERDL
ncbi:MAG: DUF308 domain-containing protein [Eubacterium sp.]|jgi:uncharacterized membrane protein HdeD (DUF308 family)|nr:DUF308 domain-containing protein [Eubacterium sp.]